MLALTPFVPHDLETLTRAYPPGAIDAAIHANTAKRFNRIEDVQTSRLRYAVGDVEVTGVLLEPATRQAGAHPLLIFNRGGNGDYGLVAVPLILRYLLPFAQAGYLVLASNYRGNDGGTGTEEFGGADVADVLTLLDIGQQHPGWDGRNRFMFGASRGGMMTYLAIKQGAALNAAATFGGVSDLAAMGEYRPEMVERVYKRRFTAGSTDLAGAYAMRSAIGWPEALTRVPLLLAHGTADTTVPPSQSEALAERLAALQAPHKLVLYEGGNHALSAHSAALIQEVQSWFKHYMK